jgi:hypothetical protein
LLALAERDKSAYLGKLLEAVPFSSGSAPYLSSGPEYIPQRYLAVISWLQDETFLKVMLETLERLSLLRSAYQPRARRWVFDIYR